MSENTSLLTILSEVCVFNKIDEQDRSYLTRIAINHQLKKGETLVYQEDHWPEIIIIESGALKWTVLSGDGREHTFFILESGKLFIGHTFFDDLHMPASLIAVKPTRLYSWKRDLIKPVISRYPEAMWDICSHLTGIMRRAREVVINLAFRQVTGRLAKFLLELSDDGDKQIERDLTLDEIATMLAATPQVVCRALYDLQAKEILKVTRAHISISHREKLKELIEEA